MRKLSQRSNPYSIDLKDILNDRNCYISNSSAVNMLPKEVYQKLRKDRFIAYTHASNKDVAFRNVINKYFKPFAGLLISLTRKNGYLDKLDNFIQQIDEQDKEDVD